MSHGWCRLSAAPTAAKMSLRGVRGDGGPLLLVLGAGEAAQHVLQRRERQVQAVHVVLAERRQPHLAQHNLSSMLLIQMHELCRRVL